MNHETNPRQSDLLPASHYVVKEMTRLFLLDHERKEQPTQEEPGNQASKPPVTEVKKN